MTQNAKATDGVREQDLLLSGGFGRSANSARAGFLPIALEQVRVAALEGIQVHIRVRADAAATSPEAERADDDHHTNFRLYCAENVRFSEEHRQRLLEHHIKFVYIRMADQSRFRRQTEAQLQSIAEDPAVAISEKSRIIYETSVELMNELLAEPQLLSQSPRLEQVSRAVTTLVMNDPTAFSHLFAASHHDFYTATHMVNVATWMVPLAYEMGYHQHDMLNRICQAGILHDMGKTTVSEEVLNKPGKLSDDDWAQIKRHPEAGAEYLSSYDHIDPLIITVTRQHHERLDGTGYPYGLKGDEIHAVSRICAVVDSFDAMTAFRPFKQRTLSVQQAIEILQKETPAKYDPEVMKAWMRLIGTVKPEDELAGLEALADAKPVAPVASTPARHAAPVNIPAIPIAPLIPAAPDNRRRADRTSLHCPARAHILVHNGTALQEKPGMPVVVHSISRSGLGFLSQVPLPIGEFVRFYLNAKGWEGRKLDGQTVRCRTHNDCWNEIGVQFTNVESEGQVPPQAMVA